MIKGLEALEKLNKIKNFIIDDYLCNNLDGWLEKQIIEFVEEAYGFKSIENILKDYVILKKCLYVTKSGAISITSYGFVNHDLLEEILK